MAQGVGLGAMTFRAITVIPVAAAMLEVLR